MDENIVLKNRLKVARAEKSYTQEQLANLCGVTRQTISSIETGQYCPTAKLALIICKVFEKKFEEIFYFKEGN
ncbi:helix-turn-helix transcriptional regulator [Oceanirhabdus sp. W0125-5]|uniref:helix-turn-helix transcriptional regulator n=1 Tax=Oceanirhabdus sp. W0125-5 TaxID=2999116 RepID=UPI0022F2A726|nr:helix-turn-helix transcriptional regulator [Oceanirhabdus sp. W0125-5]WBW96846.1 helix-turn-helix transcriptional regulator [Oceanirhabdus sp. W0125-5]